MILVLDFHINALWLTNNFRLFFGHTLFLEQLFLTFSIVFRGNYKLKNFNQSETGGISTSIFENINLFNIEFS